jgi:hypothetical protein
VSLTREGAKARLPKRETITLDDGETVVVQGLSGQGRDEFEKVAINDDGTNKPVRRALLAALGWIDEDGHHLYDATSEADLKELDALDGALLETIGSVLLRISGITKAAQETIAKN